MTEKALSAGPFRIGRRDLNWLYSRLAQSSAAILGFAGCSGGRSCMAASGYAP